MFFSRLRKDIAAAKRNDPAARNKFEIWLTYSGVHAKFLTGIEIHPAAKIAAGVFIDHGAGVVIGETAEVAEGVVIYQGVTLGGTGKESGKRHPTIERNVTISSGAKVLGGFTVGEGARIGAGAVVLKAVPPFATVVGVPGRVVRVNGERPVPDLIPEKDDPIVKELCALRERIYELEERLEKIAARGSAQIQKSEEKKDENL